jgi:plasmid replication initiation protein
MPLEADSSGSQLALALLYEQEPEILKKPVQAVHMAVTGGIQSKTQRLAFNAMLKHALEVHAKEPNKVVDTYSVSRIELMKTIGYTSPNRKHLKDALSQMQKLTVQWDFLKQDGEAVWASCVLLPFVGFDRDRIYYSYSPQIKPLLFDSKIYARLDLRIQRNFVLDASAALYEWVNRFRTNPGKLTTEMTWEDWRWVIYGEVNETSILNEYKIFKREKLKPAMTEINEKSDLAIQLIENKDGGRSVKYLQFVVEEKQVFMLENDAEQEAKAEWEKRLEDFGLSARDRKKIMGTYALDVIEAHWKFTVDRVNDKSQKPLKSPAAYLKRALEGGYASDVVSKNIAKPQTENFGSLANIQAAFNRARNDEAERMFMEMLAADRDTVIAEYNASQPSTMAHVPLSSDERIPRQMIPFYAWLAKKYWGEPDAQELFQFGIKTGALTFNGPGI